MIDLLQSVPSLHTTIDTEQTIKLVNVLISNKQTQTRCVLLPEITLIVHQLEPEVGIDPLYLKHTWMLSHYFGHTNVICCSIICNASLLCSDTAGLGHKNALTHQLE